MTINQHITRVVPITGQGLDGLFLLDQVTASGCAPGGSRARTVTHCTRVHCPCPGARALRQGGGEPPSPPRFYPPAHQCCLLPCCCQQGQRRVPCRLSVLHPSPLFYLQAACVLGTDARALVMVPRHHVLYVVPRKRKAPRSARHLAGAPVA